MEVKSWEWEGIIALFPQRHCSVRTAHQYVHIIVRSRDGAQYITQTSLRSHPPDADWTIAGRRAVSLCEDSRGMGALHTSDAHRNSEKLNYGYRLLDTKVFFGRPE